jgi:organic radical activating enzyme
MLPWKLLQLKNDAIAPDHRIVPIHLQLIPTNHCNGSCPWCSCRDVDRGIELSIGEIQNIITFFAVRGTRAVTITGGGEPTLHPHLYEMLLRFKSGGISIGLVTNGIAWGKGAIRKADFIAGAVDWIRVSTMDTTKNGDQPMWLDNIAAQLDTFLGVSFTVADNVSVELAKRICDVANHRNLITHIRFVENILDPNDELMKQVEAACSPITEKGIYQYRSTFTRGVNPCLISLLKPVVDATGHIFPCCGVQYANESFGLRQMPEQFDMGPWQIYDQMLPFDGRVCQKCYYNDYNTVLGGLIQPLQHIYHV